MAGLSAEQLATAAAVTNAYLILNRDEILAPLNPERWSFAICRRLRDDLHSALSSVLDAASVPFRLTCSFVQDMRFQQILSAERIRSLARTPDGDDHQVDEAAAFASAASKMHDFLRTDEGTDYLRDRVLAELARGLRSADVVRSSEELLLQSLVGVWSAFEVFASSFATNALNERPEWVGRALRSEVGKRLFPKSGVPIEALERFGYNVASSMGSVLLDGKRLDSLSSLADLICVLVEDDYVQRLFKHADLRLLNQRRHLVVHKRGVIDNEYLKNTADRGAVGQRLALNSVYLERHVETVCKTAVAILDAYEGAPSDRERD